MKHTSTYLIILSLFTALLFAFVIQPTPGSIKGRIIPANAALHAWAVSNQDTGTGVIQNGAFVINNLKEGRYRVIIEGLHPYKTTDKLDVVVTGGNITDVGDITLDQ